MLRIAVIEDEQEQRSLLSDFLRRYAREEKETIKIKTYPDGEDFISHFDCDYDILFMDIQMDRMNGMEAAKKVREKDETVIIIFITNMSQYAVQGYSVNAMNFIIKPVSYFSFYEKMKRAVERRRGQRQKMFYIKTDDGLARINVSKVRYVEIINRKQYIHTEKDVFGTTETMQNIEALLNDKRFFRCHVAFLVNLEFIDKICKNSAFVEGQEVPVSKYRKKEFVNALTDFMGEQM